MEIGTMILIEKSLRPEKNNRILVILFTAIVYTLLSGCGDGTEEKTAALCCAEPVALTSEVNAPEVFVHADGIYWVGSSTLKRISKTGGDVSLLAEVGIGGGSLAGDDDFLYLLSSAPGAGVGRIDRDGKNPISLGSGETYPCDMTLDEKNVYWSEEDGKIYWAAKDGSQSSRMFSSAFDCADLAVGPEYIYFADRFGIHRMDKFGENKTKLVDLIDVETIYVFDLVLKGDTLYWTQATSGEPGEVKSVSTLGGTPQVLAAGQQDVFGLAVDENHVYWTNYESGLLRRVPVGGGTIEEVYRSSKYIPFVTLDEHYIYWLDDQTLMKRVK